MISVCGHIHAIEILTMAEVNSQDNDKNTSPYDEFLRQLKEHHKLVAKESLQRLYELLKLEDPLMSKDDMYDRIMKDCLEIWQKKTIQDNMPDELKDRERQESGRKGVEKKKEITVTTSGSVASAAEATLPEPEPNRAQKEPERKLSPIETLAQVRANAEGEQTSNLLEERDRKIAKLEEQMIEQTNHFQKLMNAKVKQQSPIPTETTDALKSEISILKQRNEELEQLVKKDPSLGFMNATDMQRISNDITTITTTIPNEVEFPAKDLSTMFLDARNAKKVMYLQIKGNQVVNWESDFAREKKKGGS